MFPVQWKPDSWATLHSAWPPCSAICAVGSQGWCQDPAASEEGALPGKGQPFAPYTPASPPRTWLKDFIETMSGTESTLQVAFFTAPPQLSDTEVLNAFASVALTLVAN
jgi:hypothetical protein